MASVRTFNVPKTMAESGFKIIDTTISGKVEIEQLASEAQLVHYVRIPVERGWRPLAADIEVSATQTFPGSLLSLVDADFTWGTGKVIAGPAGREYQFDVSNKIKITWNSLFSGPYERYETLDIPEEIELADDRYYIVKIRYKLPITNISRDSLTYSIRAGLLIWNENPAEPLPAFGEVETDESPSVEPKFDFVKWAVIGGVAVAGLFAASSLLGRAAEITGPLRRRARR